MTSFQAVIPLPITDAALSRSVLDVEGVRLVEWMSGDAMRFLLVRVAALGQHVCGIVFPGSQKQVFGIDARTNIAFVADMDAIWNRSEVQFPRDAMRQQRELVQLDLPVSVRADTAAAPQPTPIGRFRVATMKPRFKAVLSAASICDEALARTVDALRVFALRQFKRTLAALTERHGFYFIATSQGDAVSISAFDKARVIGVRRLA